MKKKKAYPGEERSYSGYYPPSDRVGFFKTYYRTINFTFAVVILGALGLCWFIFQNRLDFEKNLIRRQFQESADDVGNIVNSCTDQVNGMRVKAEDHLHSIYSSRQDPLFEHLYFYPIKRYISLDSLPTELAVTMTGNLTAQQGLFLESITEDKRREINMALALNPMFKIAKENIPGSSWVYYLSSDFIMMYPWVRSYRFRYSPKLLTHEFYTKAKPETNPDHQLFWTNAYMDEAGRGLMVTCAAPVYERAKFRGTVALDITADSLNAIIRRAQREKGEVFLINDSNVLLAHPDLVTSTETDLKTLTDAVPGKVRKRLEDFNHIRSGEIYAVGEYYVYAEKIEDAPWKLIYLVSKFEIHMSILKNVGLLLVFVVGSIIMVMVTSNYIVRKEFIAPSRQLVEHIRNENEDIYTDKISVPTAWLVWFKIITAIFDEKRELVTELEKQNRNLEQQVMVRTEELRMKARELNNKNIELNKNQEELHEKSDKLSSLNEHLFDTNSKLMDREEELRKKNQDLRRTLSELKQMQQQLIESEKMASLGSIVAGVSHEINTPVGVGVTAASFLESETKRLAELYTNNNIKRSDFKNYLDMAVESSDIILSNLRRAAELVSGFKEVAVDQSSEARRYFNLAEYTEEVLRNLNARLKRTPHKVEVISESVVELDSFPGAFAQIITNLVMNSLKHAYNKDQKGKLTFKISEKSRNIYFQYSDDGKGIQPEDLKKIFEPFFTTKRGEGGSGLGLHIIYNLVIQKLEGTITCSSKVGEGTTFKIVIPRQGTRKA